MFAPRCLVDYWPSAFGGAPDPKMYGHIDSKYLGGRQNFLVRFLSAAE